MTATSPGSWRVVLFTDFPQTSAWYPEFFTSHGHRVVAIVTASTRNPGYLDVVKNAPANVDVIVSNHPRRWHSMLQSLTPDLIVSTGFPFRIPDAVLQMAPLGAVNARPTLLPRYRGTGALKWMLWNDEREAGWTLHRMVSDFDAGPVLAPVRYRIDEDNDIGALFTKLEQSFPSLWETGLPRIARQDPGEPQDESQALHVGPMPDEMQIVDWSRNARDIHNQVRAMSGGIPPHGAIAGINGKPVMLRCTRLVYDPASDPPATGSVISHDANHIVVQCGDLPLDIVAWDAVPEADGVVSER
jgi:methionyl-tRNA formyltransferase